MYKTNPYQPSVRHSLAGMGAQRRSAKAWALSAALLLAATLSPLASADAPGRGLTAQFEQSYLTFIIDHHFSALRMTELAAGTAPQRDAAVNNPQEGTAPTPNTSATPAKATSDDIKSMAREANRMQREEIVKAQKFLRDWYGATHTPQLLPEGQQQIQILEQAKTGPQFNQAFLEIFSSHHYRALAPSLDCEVKSDIQHDQLKHYCDGIVHAQVLQINDMREHLCKDFSICDYQPTTGPRGQSSGQQ